MKSNEIKEKWEQFRSQKGFLQRVDPNHPMDLFLGISEKGHAELVVITTIEPALLKSSKALDIEKRKRNDDRWATQIILNDKKNEDIFARLCSDLIEISNKARHEHEGLAQITSRFISWQKLFENVNNDLPISTLKGLVGELLFAKEVLQSHYGWDVIINAWQGPDGADRDYVLPSAWFELKTVQTGKSFIQISSLNQLDTSERGFLVKYELTESSSTDPSSVSVSTVVNIVRELMSAHPEVLIQFERKLVNIGYVDRKSYDSLFFTHSKPTYYYVNESFPKLTPQNVSPEIIDVDYSISLPAIDNWKVTEEEIWN